MKGIRQKDVPDSSQPHDRLEPGGYRRTRHRGGPWYWECRPPGDLPETVQGSLKNHKIEEHEDGTITATPSLLIETTWAGEEISWHGYLEHGEWREV